MFFNCVLYGQRNHPEIKVWQCFCGPGGPQYSRSGDRRYALQRPVRDSG